MMYVNLHTLPPGQHMFTLYFGRTPDEVEESDVTVQYVANVEQQVKLVLAAATPTILDDYEPGMMVWGIVDQSTGDVVFDGRRTDTDPILVEEL